MSKKSFSAKNTLIQAASAEKSGDLSGAAEQYSAILARFPNHTSAKKGLRKIHKLQGGGAVLSQNDVNKVVGLLQAGQFQEVVNQVNILLQIAPREALLHNIHGMALSNLGHVAAAEKPYQQAVKLNPNYAEALGNLGAVYLELGKLDQAVSTLLKGTALKPDFAEAHNSLGTAYAQRGQFDLSMQAFDKAIALRPDYVNAMNSKGAALSDAYRVSDAIKMFTTALKFDPDNTDVLVNLGYAYNSSDLDDLAVKYLTRALAINPNLAEARYRLGVAKSQLGDTKEALKDIDLSLQLNPLDGQVYRTKSTLKKYKADDPDIAEMDRIYKAHKQDDTLRMHLAFALGKACEDAQSYPAAFSYWAEGNTLRRALIDYSTQSDVTLFSDIKSVFDKKFFDTYSGFRDTNARPIFVVGMMRSGTSLVEQILSSHSRVFGAGEITLVNKFGRGNLRAMVSGQTLDLGGFGQEYLEILKEHTDNAKRPDARVVDKLPINFLWIGLIKAVFPNASIINLDRDPRDNCLSIFKNYFEDAGHEYAYELTELGKFYSLYSSMIDHWNTVIPGAVISCDYDRLIADFEPECRNLLQACDLPWQDSVLEFYKTKRTVKTASVSQVRQKLYTSSVQSWRRYEQELAPLLNVLQQNGLLPAN